MYIICDLWAHLGWVLDFAWMCIPATVSYCQVQETQHTNPSSEPLPPG